MIDTRLLTVATLGSVNLELSKFLKNMEKLLIYNLTFIYKPIVIRCVQLRLICMIGLGLRAAIGLTKKFTTNQKQDM